MQIEFGQSVIPYTLQRSNKRTTLSIQVSAQGVEVIAPIDATIQDIESKLLKKATWILQKQADFDEMIEYNTPRQFRSGEKLPYLGRQYRLKVITEPNVKNASFSYKQGKFIATVPEDISPEQYRNLLYPLYKQWIMERGDHIARERIKQFTSKYGKYPEKITIKDQQQRWGSCTANQQVLLNWHIFLAPMHAIDYVIAHELAHLTVMDHSEAFWDTLSMLYPEYVASKEWLRIHGRQLYI